MLGVSEYTVIRANLPTSYIGNHAYVPRNKSLAIYLAAHTHAPPEPPKPRGRRR